VSFLSNGDFSFPFEWLFYWAKHFYMWAYQAGAPNPDGIIRLPGRVFNILVFSAFGNLAVGYFYIAICLIAAFLSFWYFSKVFLNVKSRSVQLVGALFFAINPVFLGNLSKIGLILAVAMLPFALALLKKWFETHKPLPLLLCIVCINIALLHPYTFTVNLAILGAYFIFKLISHRENAIKNILRILPFGLVAILLNAYLILPLAGLGTIDKTAILDDVDTSEVDYTRLVDIANTGDLFTGLSLSKNVLKDYEFYNFEYMNYYFAGAFLIYLVIFGVYCWANKRATRTDMFKFLISVGAVLLLILFSAVNYLYVGELIKWLIGLPGGWIFRSPLKWQLYIPVFMGVALVLALKYLKRGREFRLACAALLVGFVLANGYLCVDIYNKLLVPRTVDSFQALNDMKIDYKNMLFVGSGECTDLAMDHPRLMSELNQVFLSKNVQVKRTNAVGLSRLHLDNFDYIFTCRVSDDASLLKGYNFVVQHKFAEDAFTLYANQAPRDYIYATTGIVSVNNRQDLSGKHEFLGKVFGKTLPFYVDGDSKDKAITLQDPYDSLSFRSLHDGLLKGGIKVADPDQASMLIKNDQPLYYRMVDGDLVLSVTPRPEFTELAPGDYRPLAAQLSEGDMDVFYYDPGFDYKNLIANPSFEQGMWRDKVSNCFAYDRSPSIKAELEEHASTDGQKSLKLSAKRHVACMGPESIKVDVGARYLLSFDYQSKSGRSAGFSVTFNNEGRSEIKERLEETDGQWSTFSKVVAVPEGANALDLKLSAFPDSANLDNGVAVYDNVHLVKIPDVRQKVYLVSNHNGLADPVPAVSYTNIDPTKKEVAITAATKPFYLVMKDGYHQAWQLGLKGSGDIAADHIKADFVSNGWYVDPKKICENRPVGCMQKADGTYDLSLVIEFTPQRWFYTGLIISGATLAGCIIYLIIHRVVGRRRKERFELLKADLHADEPDGGHFARRTAGPVSVPKRAKPRKQKVRVIQ
jgi:hypothetical protein